MVTGTLAFKVSGVRTEYAKLLEEKKKTYAEYRHSREEMRVGVMNTLKAQAEDVLLQELVYI